jgi:hypothetical protein
LHSQRHGARASGARKRGGHELMNSMKMMRDAIRSQTHRWLRCQQEFSLGNFHARRSSATRR